MKLRYVVEHITYQNPENGYSVLKVKVKDYADLVTLVWNLLDVVVGSVLLVEGHYISKYAPGLNEVCSPENTYPN